MRDACNNDKRAAEDGSAQDFLEDGYGSHDLLLWD